MQVGTKKLADGLVPKANTQDGFGLMIMLDNRHEVTGPVGRAGSRRQHNGIKLQLFDLIQAHTIANYLGRNTQLPKIIEKVVGIRIEVIQQ